MIKELTNCDFCGKARMGIFRAEGQVGGIVRVVIHGSVRRFCHSFTVTREGEYVKYDRQQLRCHAMIFFDK